MVETYSDLSQMDVKGEEVELSSCHDELTVDISHQALKKIERANHEQKGAAVLIASDNEIQRLDNLDSYSQLKKVFLMNNQLVRMYGISQLIQLEVLDLTNNSLVTIEGLKDLKNLKELYLGKNKIKVIEHLNNNLDLEKIDLSENIITHISDISYLTQLKELYLHGNKLIHLKQCEKNLPENLELLTLHNNSIFDLNEVSHLAQFNSFKELSISNNPCVQFRNEPNSFNYRPFIKNWCTNLIILDDHPLDDIECLKAEWLYSQGRGRSFRPGEHEALVEYLSSVCPLKEADDDTEDVKKLKLILSKAQQHQKQLKEQLSTGNLVLQDPYKLGRRKKAVGLSERMVTSCQGSPPVDLRNSPDLMTRSLDSGIRRSALVSKKNKEDTYRTPLQTSTTFIPIPDTLISPDYSNATSPFVSTCPKSSSISSRTSRSSSRNSPRSTPESKRKLSGQLMKKTNESCSPLLLKKGGKLGNSRSSTPLELGASPSLSPLINRTGSITKEIEKRYRGTSEEEENDMLKRKILGCQPRANQKKYIKKQFDGKNDSTPAKSPTVLNGKRENVPQRVEAKPIVDNTEWKAAVCIQRRWRGYRARNLNNEVIAACKDIQLSRMQEYMAKVISEVESTRIALEGNRKLQVLQMQAINALWKKMTNFQASEPAESSNESRLTIQELITTCSNLNKQVEGLQAMMRTMQNVSGSCRSAPIATQTEIVAVHTPKDDGKDIFPYSLQLKSSISTLETCCFLSDKEDHSNVSQEELVTELVSTMQPDVRELYSNKNLDDNSSEQELFLIPKFQGENEGNCTNVGLSKPLVKLNETPDLMKSSVEESDLAVGLNNEPGEVSNTCSSSA